jgi:hypothetical protein
VRHQHDGRLLLVDDALQRHRQRIWRVLPERRMLAGQHLGNVGLCELFGHVAH